MLNPISVIRSKRALIALATLAFSALLQLAPAAQADVAVVAWNPPTPADGTQFAVTVDSAVSFSLSASTALPLASVHIAAVTALPTGATLSATDGNPASATFNWTPSQPGDFTVQFTASTTGGSAPTLTYAIHVRPPPPTYPRSYTLSDTKIARWAFVLRPAVVRAQPSSKSRVVTRLGTITSDGTQNLVLLLDGVDLSAKQTWFHVRLPILPNNRTGWVSRGYLSNMHTVHTHLYVDTTTFNAVLQRDGVEVFRTVVGVGKPYWPTPKGEFYIRDKLTSFGDPFYGPIAFGTSARSAVLTDWPGGGYVGVHGTSLPQLIPGKISHGCIRMRNSAIVKLSRMMPVGTPLTVT